MPVANKQINELSNIIKKYIDLDKLKQMLKDFSETEAYSKNTSFKETIDRLNKSIKS